MNFPNTVKGLKRIFAGEIIGMLGFAFMLMASLIMLPKAGESEVNDDGAAVLIFVSSFVIAAITSTIICAVGIFSIRKDDKYFKRAFILYIISLSINAFVTVVLPVIFIIMEFVFPSKALGDMLDTANKMVSSLTTNFVNITDSVIMIIIMLGITSMYRKLDDDEAAKSVKKSIRTVVVLVVLHIIINFAVSFMGGNTGSIESLLLSLPSLVIVMAEYVIYLSSIKRLLATLSPAGNKTAEEALSE